MACLEQAIRDCEQRSSNSRAYGCAISRNRRWPCGLKNGSGAMAAVFDRHLALNGKALCNLTIDARSGAFASFGGALRRPFGPAPFNIRHVSLRLRFNLPQPGVSIIRAAPQST